MIARLIRWIRSKRGTDRRPGPSQPLDLGRCPDLDGNQRRNRWHPHTRTDRAIQWAAQRSLERTNR